MQSHRWKLCYLNCLQVLRVTKNADDELQEYYYRFSSLLYLTGIQRRQNIKQSRNFNLSFLFSPTGLADQEKVQARITSPLLGLYSAPTYNMSQGIEFQARFFEFVTMHNV